MHRCDNSIILGKGGWLNMLILTLENNFIWKWIWYQGQIKKWKPDTEETPKFYTKESEKKVSTFGIESQIRKEITQRSLIPMPRTTSPPPPSRIISNAIEEQSGWKNQIRPIASLWKNYWRWGSMKNLQIIFRPIPWHMRRTSRVWS